MRSRTILVMAISACLVAACTDSGSLTPIPSAVATPSSTPVASQALAPTPTIAASVEPSFTVPVETTAEATHDGIHVVIEVDPVPLRPGVETWATMTVTNVGTDTVHYFTDGCGIPIHAHARLTGAWLEGVPQAGVAAYAKDLALADGVSHGTTPFIAEQWIGRDVACADYAEPHRLDPGEPLTQRARWQPFDDAPMPDVAAEIVAMFPYDRRGDDDAPEGLRRVVETTLPAAILGGSVWPWLTPAEAMDVALADAEFLRWLESISLDGWNGPSLELDTGAGTWRVVATQETAVGWIAELTMDAATGEILGRRFE